MTVPKSLVFWLLLFSEVTPALQSPVSFIRSSLMSSKRLSRDHHDMEGLTTSLAPRENTPRDIAAEVFNKLACFHLCSTFLGYHCGFDEIVHRLC